MDKINMVVGKAKLVIWVIVAIFSAFMIIAGIIGLLDGGSSSRFGNMLFMTLAGVALLLWSIKRALRAHNGGGNALGLCNNCLNTQIHGRTIRGLINSEAFSGHEGKLALLSHLKEHNCCYGCVEIAKNHAKSFVMSNGLNIDVEEFYRNI